MEQEKKDRADVWMVRLTGALAVVGFMQLVVFGLQAFQLQRAVVATKEAAGLVPALERAYVFFEAFGTNIGFLAENGWAGHDPKNPPSINYRIINYGKTPAIIKEISVDLCITDFMTEPRFVPTPLEAEIVLAAITIEASENQNGIVKPPSYEFAKRESMNERPAEVLLQDVKSKTKYLWLTGRVVYEDVFGREHITPFWYRSDYGIGTLARMRRHGDAKYHKRT